MKILFINGSHRDGNTDLIIKSAQKILNDQNIENRELVLRNIEMKLPDGCEHCAESEICPNIADDFSHSIEPTIHDYDIYIFCTPVWSDNVTPLTKIFVDRIVSWCHPDRMYLQNKKIAVITHGMADPNSWKTVTSWFEGICTWEKSNFGSSFSANSSGKIGDISVNENKLKTFLENLL